MTIIVLDYGHLFESAWCLHALELLGCHVALHVVRIDLLSGLSSRPIYRLDYGEDVVIKGQTLVLLALHARLMPSIQRVRQPVLMHEHIVACRR